VGDMLGLLSVHDYPMAEADLDPISRAYKH
jgi:hypothetical protein